MSKVHYTIKLTCFRKQCISIYRYRLGAYCTNNGYIICNYKYNYKATKYEPSFKVITDVCESIDRYLFTDKYDLYHRCRYFL